MESTMVYTGLLLALLGLAAWHDLRHYRIPNLLTFGGAGLALVLSVFLPDGQGWALCLLGWITGLLILLPLFALRAMGAGDVKLLAMAGAFSGPAGALAIGLYTLIAGGVLALVVAVGGGRLQQALRNVQAMTVPCLAPPAPAGDKPVSAGKLPYGVAILAGGLAWWWQVAA